MRFSFSILPIFAAIATVVASPIAQPNLVRADAELGVWFKDAVAGFFPNHTGWDTSYAQYFNQSLVASFDFPAYNYTTLAGLYSQFPTLIAANGYNLFGVEFTAVTAYPSTSDAGGIVVATGRVVAYKNGTLVKSGTDGVFAKVSVVGGERKFTEWREISNFQF
ncbi:hypothetical protein DFH09DRAFT_1493172 [Mycena vulgaris]|nr:hypothetical protein DFH09DRAFT_1493172 [Mycena vulgaris]